MPSFLNLFAGAAAFVVTWVVVNAATGKRGLFLLYGNHLDEQRATVDGHAALVGCCSTCRRSVRRNPPRRSLFSSSLSRFYHSTCLISDYAGGARLLPPDPIPSGVDVAGNERLWRLPLAVQLPSLVLLPLFVVALAALLVWVAEHRGIARSSARALQGLLEITDCCERSGSRLCGKHDDRLEPPLRYGRRGFLPPALLTGVVAVVLVLSSSLPRLLAVTTCPVVSSGIVFVGRCRSVGEILPWWLALPTRGADGISRHRRRALGEVSDYGFFRRERVTSPSTRGQREEIRSRSPNLSTLTFECGGGRPGFTLMLGGWQAVSASPSRCPHARLAHAWPTVMGLPPGTFEVAAIKVKSA